MILRSLRRKLKERNIYIESFEINQVLCLQIVDELSIVSLN